MTDDARHAQNRRLSAETYAPFGARVLRVCADLEAQGFRPRIQQAWRSPVEQLQKFKEKKSKVRWGFHNATTLDGKPDALAVDIVDEDYPVPVNDQRLWPLSFRHLILWLAVLAEQHELHTGIAWGLGADERKTLNTALHNDPLTYAGGYGWDSLHLEPRDLTVSAAKAGRRPWV